MRKKLPILLLALIILLQVFVPAVYAISKNEAISSTASLCSLDTTPEGAGGALTTPAGLVREGQTSVIGKMRDLDAPGAMGSGEFKVANYLPDMGNPKANWAQNDGILRSIMNEGKPIRDVSLYPMENAGFLGAERNLLQSRGWSYSNGYWYAPK